MPRVYGDHLTKEIESAVLAHLGELGSFSTEEIFDSVTFSNRGFKRLFNKLVREFPEFNVAVAYETYIGKRVTNFVRRKDHNGDRIFIGIPTTEGDNRTVRYVMRMDATQEQLRKAGYNTLAKGMQVVRAGMTHVISGNTLDAIGVDTLADLNVDYDSVNSRIKDEAGFIMEGLSLHAQRRTRSLSGTQTIKGITTPDPED